MSTALPEDLVSLAEETLASCRAGSLKLTTAESCTGGLIAACVTEVAGASRVFDRGFVTYSNDAKTGLLGVPKPLIDEHGAVSEPVARAMAEGALARSEADIAISVTGIAGPGGGSAAKPVGLVFIAAARTATPTRVERHIFPGDRGEIRRQTVEAALRLALAAASA